LPIADPEVPLATRDDTKGFLIAVSELRKMPYGAIWFIPILLDHRTVPRIPIGPSLTLHDLQWVSLADNWDEGIARIANITLDLKKKFREEIDKKSELVINAEREPIQLREAYTMRFREEYDPLEERYEEIKAEKQRAFLDLKKLEKEWLEENRKSEGPFMLLWVGLLLVIILIVSFIKLFLCYITKWC
jgi:maltodextrin utilization protein YvdJ